MMWYSPIPPPEVPLTKATEKQKIRTIEQEGRWFTVRVTGPSHGEILSLRSMMPQDYLNPAWRPGQMLSWIDGAAEQESLVALP